DAVSWTNDSLAGWKILVAYAWRVRTTSAVESSLDHFAMSRAEFRGFEGHVIHLRLHLLDDPGGTSTDRDKATAGVGIQGDLPAASYAFAYDRQTGYADNSADGGTLLAVFGGAKWAGLTIGAGYEEFSGESGSRRAFDTAPCTGSTVSPTSSAPSRAGG
ncbi:MAG: hypothetical protein O7D96_09470, partial [SAR324 cluster bacterium]|nr:hypothetical protein [SAR324 cluster bacterium]